MDETEARDAAEAFDTIMSGLQRPVAIVTCTAFEPQGGRSADPSSGGERAGCLVGFSTQCSIHPPRYLVCISVLNHTYGVIRRADLAAVHLVPPSRFDLVELFAGQTGDEVDKFARCDWSPGPGGVPILDGCPTWFAGRIVARPDAGDSDHHLFVLAPTAAGDPNPTDHGWLRYADVAHVVPGHPA
jgi:flavin reductase (DIM6/NTAB) family NADH-FMN oxidoreductase RutF